MDAAPPVLVLRSRVWNSTPRTHMGSPPPVKRWRREPTIWQGDRSPNEHLHAKSAGHKCLLGILTENVRHPCRKSNRHSGSYANGKSTDVMTHVHIPVDTRSYLPGSCGANIGARTNRDCEGVGADDVLDRRGRCWRSTTPAA